MEINFHIVIIQIINFLITLWILNRFLFKPIMRNMRKRDEEIQSRLASAAQSKQMAEDAELTLAAKISDFEKKQSSLLQDATHRATLEQADILKRFHGEMIGRRESFRAELNAEKEVIAETLGGELNSALLSVLKQALSDFGAGKLEDAITAGFIKELKSPSLRAYAKQSSQLTITSSFSISPANRALIKKSLRAKSVKFQKSTDISYGITLTSGDTELSFGLDGYIDELKSKLGSKK